MVRRRRRVAELQVSPSARCVPRLEEIRVRCLESRLAALRELVVDEAERVLTGWIRRSTDDTCDTPPKILYTKILDIERPLI
jgi:hypothetical protein